MTIGYRWLDRDGLPTVARLAVVLWAGLAASSAWPISFGTVAGGARFGSALDVRVPLALQHPAEALAPCVQVDVWYGRVPLDASAVRADVQIVGKRDGSVRVRAAAPVDQPVVTLGVSTTCGVRTARNFVLVAEGLPAGFHPAVAQPDLQPQPQPAVASDPALQAVAVVEAPAAPTSVAPAAARPVRPATAHAAPVRLARSDTLPAAAPAAARPVSPPRPAAAPDTGPRLRLTAMLAPYARAMTEAERDEARAVWKVLQTAPDVLAREVRQPQGTPVAAPAVASASAPASAPAPAPAPAPMPAPAPTVASAPPLPAASPSPAVPAPASPVQPRQAPWNRVAAAIDTVIGLWPLALLAALAVLAGVALAMRVQRRQWRRGRRRMPGERHLPPDSMHSQTDLMGQAGGGDGQDAALALDIDLDGRPPAAQATARHRP